MATRFLGLELDEMSIISMHHLTSWCLPDMVPDWSPVWMEDGNEISDCGDLAITRPVRRTTRVPMVPLYGHGYTYFSIFGIDIG